MDIKGSSIQAFLDEMASSSPTPGGGTAAALAGAISAGLIGMVCNLTIGRPRFAAAEDDLRAALAQAEALRKELAALAEADTGAFDQVMAAYRLPKDSDEQRIARQAAIQTALKQATQIPLETAIACAAALRLVSRIIAHLNPNALSDAGTAAVLAEAGLRGAQFNVAVNLAGIQDAEFVQEARQALARALEGADEERDRVVAYISGA